jgi:predicted lipid-binding transport protein (Tim44 family)
MHNKTSKILSFLFIVTLLLASIHEAEAKRFGGGSSFGSKPSYSQPFQGSNGASGFSQPLRSPSQTAANSQNQTARQGFANRGGMMGMLGGLALGGILGSLFFGGAFEHINFLDMLLVAGLAFVVYRLFLARKTLPQQQPIASAYSRNSYQNNDNAYQPAASGSRQFDTDLLFKAKNAAPIILPAGFDQVAFLASAERAYRHLQVSWDKRDLAAIRSLATDKVFAEIQDQLRASNELNKTEVLTVNSQLLAIRELGTELEATVLFDSVLRENDSAPEEIKEVWHFIKPINSQQTKWFLDGIQQIQN